MNSGPDNFELEEYFAQLREHLKTLWEKFFEETQKPLNSYKNVIEDLENKLSSIEPSNWYSLSQDLINQLNHWVDTSAYPFDLLSLAESNVGAPILKEVSNWPLETKPVFNPEWLKPSPMDNWWQKFKKLKSRFFYGIKLGLFKTWKKILVFSKNKNTRLILRYPVPAREFAGLYVSIPLIVQVRKHSLSLSEHWDSQALKLQDAIGNWNMALQNKSESFFSKIQTWIGEQKSQIVLLEDEALNFNKKIKEQIDKEADGRKIFFQYQYQLSSAGLLAPRIIKRRYLKNWRRLQKTLQLQKSGWKNFWKFRVNEWKKDLVLQSILFESCYHYENLGNPYKNRIGIPGRQLIAQVNETLNNMKSNVESAKGSDFQLEQLILQLRANGFAHFKWQINQFVNQIVATEIASPIHTNIEKMESLKAQVAQPFQLVKLRRVKSGIPLFKEVEVNLQSTISYQGLKKYSKNLQNTIADLNKKKAKFCESLVKLIDVLEFNLEVSSNIQDKLEEQQLELIANIIDGIHRIEAITNDIKLQIEKEEDDWGNIVVNELNQFLELLLKLQNQDQLFRHFIASSQSNITERSNFYRVKWGRKYIRLRRKSLIAGASTWNKIASVFTQAKKVSRLENIANDGTGGLNDYLRDTAKQISDLPYIYKTVFKFSALENERLYLERKEEAQKLLNNYTGWQKGQLGATAIAGEKGCGLTSFLNIELERIAPKEKQFRLLAKRGINNENDLVNFFSDLDITAQNINLEGLAQKILAREERVICIIEDFHLLFLRTLEGVALIEKLQSFISQTESKVFWIITCNIYSWKLQDPILQLASAFKEVLQVEKLNIVELEKLIDSRHSLTGFQLNFLTEVRKKNLWEKWKKETQEALKKEFLKKLGSVSDGNISVAIFYWLRSIAKIEKEKLFIQSELSLDKNLIYLLSSEQLFTLAALVQHVSLSSKEHALIFRQDPSKSQVQLRKLADLGILYVQNDRYELHFFLYRALIKILMEKHLLLSD